MLASLTTTQGDTENYNDEETCQMAQSNDDGRRSYSIWPEVGLFRRDMYRSFSNLSYQDYCGASELSFWSNEEESIILADISGFDLEHVEITVEHYTLLISLSCKLPGAESIEDTELEIDDPDTYPTFFHAVPLPVEVDSDSIEADFDKHLLHIRVPHAEFPPQLTLQYVQ